MSVAEAADLGVRRISVGAALAKAAWDGLAKAAQEIAERGTFGGFTPSDPPLNLNKLFGG
jgi:2-methylisocitrate lyase-like PEP mutase family enzyme